MSGQWGVYGKLAGGKHKRLMWTNNVKGDIINVHSNSTVEVFLV